MSIPNKPPILYHGSSVLVDVLKPHQAYDWMHEEGCQFAVYATSDKDGALAFALGAIPDENGCVDQAMDPKYGLPLKMIFFRGHPNYGGKGYLYVLSSDTFRHTGGNEWASPVPVKPLEVIEIEVDDYLHLCRYATKEEKREYFTMGRP